LKPPHEDKWRLTLAGESGLSRKCPKHSLPLSWYEAISPEASWSGGQNRRDGSNFNYGNEIAFCPQGHLVKEFLSPEGEIWKVDEEEESGES
jgi:hypothetical protein